MDQPLAAWLLVLAGLVVVGVRTFRRRPRATVAAEKRAELVGADEPVLVVPGRRLERLTLDVRLGDQPGRPRVAGPAAARARIWPRHVRVEVGRGPIVLDLFELQDCDLPSPDVLPRDDPDRRTTIRRGTLVRCAINSLGIDGAIFEELEIDGLRTRGPLFFRGSVFRHVRVRGAVGSIAIRPWREIGPEGPRELALAARFRAANERYYRTVDWALDISGATFAECELAGIPARLIRRNPEHHFVIRRSNLAGGRWRTRPIRDTYFGLTITNMLNEGFQDQVLVAPMRSRDRARLLAALQDLRAAGIAEPD